MNMVAVAQRLRDQNQIVHRDKSRDSPALCRRLETAAPWPSAIHVLQITALGLPLSGRVQNVPAIEWQKFKRDG